MSYEERLMICKLEPLKTRWENLFVKFAKDAVKSGRLHNWLQPNPSTNNACLRKQNTFYHPFVIKIVQ